ncbi:NifB/NifX family molybdenum-iron cluster-binding protein [Salidesulfovibrio onnuriiensis]|uniref:NifB/NifX family molybdenum-iron cluster-binding protein n=1 Tax=Salidesulfovibrio onnuriiensis TaxID=2583823 RepID=UPI0011C85975|nr:NifB/NifX family molybdenum-iron cluster-binding protein [Salidesulfovibrio onnuriiensis]
MKVAVPTRDGCVDDHFGHCDHFSVFTIEDNAVVAREKLESPEGCGCKSNIASVLKEQGVSVMLAGNMGQGAVDVLGANDVQVIRGCSGDIEELVQNWIAGKVKDEAIVCDHHDCGSLHQL